MYLRPQLQAKEIPKWGKYLRGKWKEDFAGHLSTDKKKEIHLDSFLWHICSFEETEFISGEAAIAALLKQKKDKCTLFFEFIDDAYLIENPAKLILTDLLTEEEDFYVMDWKSQWTFMATHESEYGPYFISNKP